MDNTNKTIALRLNKDELQEIYYALNDHCLLYADKSELMQKILAGTMTIDDLANPDYYYLLHDFVTKLQSKVYRAEMALEKKA